MGINIDLRELQEVYQAMADKLRADGCKGCIHIDVPEYKMPCRECSRGCKDRWKAGKNEQ